jgi:hypothetical protein
MANGCGRERAAEVCICNLIAADCEADKSELMFLLS